MHILKLWTTLNFFVKKQNLYTDRFHSLVNWKVWISDIKLLKLLHWYYQFSTYHSARMFSLQHVPYTVQTIFIFLSYICFYVALNKNKPKNKNYHCKKLSFPTPCLCVQNKWKSEYFPLHLCALFICMICSRNKWCIVFLKKLYLLLRKNLFTVYTFILRL